ncbi:hypothetical protein ABTZ99_08490 [Actinosynnema sp. NPDC002837]
MVRPRLLAALLAVIGGGALVAGALVDGYAQAVSVEVGSAVLLLVPFVLIERTFGRMIDRRVEDGVARALREPGPVPADRPDVVIAAIGTVVPDVVAVRADRTGLDYVIEGSRSTIAVAVQENRHPLDQSTVERLWIIARRAGLSGLLVVSHQPMTDLARRWVERHRQVRVAVWEGAVSGTVVTESLRDLLEQSR